MVNTGRIVYLWWHRDGMWGLVLLNNCLKECGTTGWYALAAAKPKEKRGGESERERLCVCVGGGGGGCIDCLRGGGGSWITFFRCQDPRVAAKFF
jgi:hypothetical protein